MIMNCAQYTGPCRCGRTHTLETKKVVVDYGALDHFEEYMEELGLTGKRAVVYDTVIYKLTEGKHVKADQEIVLESKGLFSEKGLIENMMKQLDHPDVIVAFGAGTIMDFGRYPAYQLGIPFVAIPTLASSDGFTANICSIVIDGQKKSIPMQAADAVICDIGIVAGAPLFLTIAGVQDIMAKVVSIADWKIASLVSGEYFCQKVCDMAQEALDIMVRCAHELAEGKEPDYEAMAYTQMLSGLTMQILSNSRAASGAEHLVAHLVEMKPRGFEKAHGLHGECVGVGTILCAEAYHKLAERETIEVKPFEPIDEDWVRTVFGPLADGIMKENENDVLKTFPPENIRDHWQEIREIIAAIPPAEELVALYTKIGAKHSLEELEIDPAVKDEFLDISSAIRNRLTLARMTRLIVK